ncbi:MAG: transcription-repair coupling factor [Clostridiaceae bacterium]|nr:transcription-repair coupling factor [Clostridiaceae bacterium]
MSEQILDLLFAQTLKDPALRRILKPEAEGNLGPVNFIGPSDTQKAWLALVLGRENKRVPCILVPDELRARSLAADLRALCDRQILIFRPRELNLVEAAAVSREVELQRLAILAQIVTGHQADQGQIGAIVVPAAAILQKLMPRSAFVRKMIRVQVGQRLDIERLCQALISIGYERTRQVDGPGQFAQRGDIVDVVPAQPEDGRSAEGLRISFFDVEIDSIKRFDPETQRSTQMLSQAIIAPAREILIDPDKASLLAEEIRLAGEEIRRNLPYDEDSREAGNRMQMFCRRDAERIEGRMMFAGLDRWVSRIYPQAESVLDYCLTDGFHILIDEPSRFDSRLDAAQAEMTERIKTMLAKGQIAAAGSEVIFRGVDIRLRLDQYGQAMALCQIASSGNGLPGAVQVKITGRPADGWRGREGQLITELKSWQQAGRQAILFAGSESRQARLRSLLLEHGVTCPVTARTLPRGFIWPAADLMTIGTQDIYGSERSARRHKKSGAPIDLFSDLVPGERVVHETHGIGRYEGLVNLESGGVRRDYLKIVYAGDDVLYIPTESLAQIQKYVGVQGREPRLSKLGGQEWMRLKTKARESIRKLATDLIGLYAQRSTVKGHAFGEDTVWQQEFEENFPFEETEDQLRSIREIKRDMESEKVMDRLLCGDVGFGKTEVAFRAMFKCVMDGRQAAMLAPTTVLAQQHFENLMRRVEGFPVNIGLLSRFASEAMQRQTLQGLASGRIDMVVGTHRLLSADVKMKDLGLLVVDEEQRFGVDHKEQIKAAHAAVDVLTLTATPIPRTLHMAMSGIRDISVLEVPPLDRRPVQTYVMEYDEAIIGEAVLREISRRGQVFYLFNDTRRIIEKAAALEKQLPGARVAYAHGKMRERRLEEIMAAFIGQQFDILVCTTIIESGIDMPNVNTIIVEGADRLGLAQLYQLRGRVGRSDRQAFAYVTYRGDKVLSEVAAKRLAAIRDFTELGSGFKIALRDLEVRGAGNLLGAEQHGNLEAIGYDLYTRMLEETIQELQGKEPIVKTSATIEISIDAYLPKIYIPDEGQRMDMYRRIAAITNRADYQDVLDECLDRFGEIPAAAMALVDISYAKASAERLGFQTVRQQQTNLVLTYAENARPDMGILSGLLNSPEFKGRLLFNAGTKPYLVFRHAAQDKSVVARQLRRLFMSAEEIGETA